MKSRNEWDQLKKVIVGRADYACMPEMERSYRHINFADKEDVSNVPNGLYPPQVIQEANEDLEVFVQFLLGEGVEVLRPEKKPTGYYSFCPRDVVVSHGDVAFAAPMPLRARKDDWKTIAQHFDNLKRVECSYDDQLYDDDCICEKDILALTEHSPAFDAANILKANDDILYLVSNSGNKKGSKKLQSILGDDINVHLLENVYSYMHIDTTVAFLKEGLLLANPERIKDKNMLPHPFNKWDVIWCPEPVDIGYFPNYNNASPWINMNLFSVNPNLVVLEENQNPTRKELEKHGIECAMLPMRHARTLSGCFHCVTLDIDRG
jgi:N-dimethylarginine dimethylaminohydrolase|tara:strand:+ start:517 stop:1479 length:963 start_codon:yes stop_codon:yes gene_type:complete